MPRPALTARELSVLSLFVREEYVNEGTIHEHCWPWIRQPRLVVNSLKRKGLVTLGPWLDEYAGYELRLTDAGREAVE